MLFSIITITRNNLAGLQKTSASVLANTCNDMEWIVVDGASEDSSVAYLQSLPSVHLHWTSSPDTGIYDAMNKGIEAAQGQYLIFLNAGDALASPTILCEIANTLNTAENFDFVYGDSLENSHSKKARPASAIAYGMFTHHQAMFYKRAMIGTLRYNTVYKIAADYDFTWRFLRGTQHTLYIPSPICIFESGGISQQQAVRGRYEQFQIRHHNNACSPFINVVIYGLQTCLYQLRRICPQLYWFLKRTKT